MIRFHTNLRMLRSPMDAAGYCSVFFLLIAFLLLATHAVLIPGLEVKLPLQPDAKLPSVSGPVLTVVLNAGGTAYFDNQVVTDARLKEALQNYSAKSKETITLLILGDTACTSERILQISAIASEAGIQKAFLGTRPRPNINNPAGNR